MFDQAEYQRKWRQENADQIRVAKRAWKEANRDRHNASCRASYHRNRERHLAWILADREANPEKHAARKETRRAIRNGELIRQPCENCGAESSETHHPDYSKPLDVHWLCRPCHGKEHRRF